MLKDDNSRLVFLALAAYAISFIMVIVGLTLAKSALALVVFYIIGMLLACSALLALFNNFRKDTTRYVFVILMIIGVIAVFLDTLAFIQNP